MTTDDIRQAIENYPKILHRANAIVKIFEKDNVCSYYVNDIIVMPDRVTIKYREEFFDGVPSNHYLKDKSLDLPIEMLDPEWEDKEVRKAVSKWKKLIEERA